MVVAYLLAMVVAGATGWALRGESTLWTVFLSDVAGTVVVFVFSYAFRNSSFYDAYWSVAPMAIAVCLAAQGVAAGANLFRVGIVVALVWWWGARLTYNWWRGWTGLGHEDWRYTDLRHKTGRAYPWVDFFGIHLFPTVQVFLGCVALYPALVTSQRAFATLDAIALLITGGAIYIESRADVELHRFVHGERQPGEIMARGLWAYSRHPNYFGEMGFWWGLALFAYAADPTFLYGPIGALCISVMFVFISVPMIDERSLERRPAYAEHMRKVSGIVPWFPRRLASGGEG